MSGGSEYLAIPGPSVMPDAVLRAMHRKAPNIYEGALVDMTGRIVEDLNKIAFSSGHVALYVCNGHGVWEAALSNTVTPGDKVLALVTGNFAGVWADIAEQLGADVERMDFGLQSPVDPDQLEARLRADTEHKITMILATATDTATSIRNDMRAMRAAIDAAGHPAVLAIDAVAAFACDDIRMDDWGIDMLLTGSQKGLMTPPGMGVLFYNDRADALRDRAERVTPYWDWRPRTQPDVFYRYFYGTAPTHHLHGMRAALDMILDEGIEAVFARHARLAQGIWAAAEAWGEGGALRLNVADRAARSHAVTALSLTGEDGTRLRRWTEHEAGLTLGIGIGFAERDDPGWHSHFRIGHMGHVNTHMIMGALGTIEAGFHALGISHGSGALSAAAKAMAQS
ncbi:MAG: aminotransferase class V-fold PLP-dependent enzyme [Pseudomonadota bacterium]